MAISSDVPYQNASVQGVQARRCRSAIVGDVRQTWVRVVVVEEWEWPQSKERGLSVAWPQKRDGGFSAVGSTVCTVHPHLACAPALQPGAAARTNHSRPRSEGESEILGTLGKLSFSHQHQKHPIVRLAIYVVVWLP